MLPTYEPMPVVDIGDCYLRTVKVSDYKDMFEYGSDPEVTKYLSWGPFRYPKEAKLSIERYNLPRVQKGLPIGYAIIHKKDHKMIGMIEYHTICHTSHVGEIGYVLNRKYQGLGIMSRALIKMIEVGFNYLNLNRIEIRHTDFNIASKKVILKADFRFEGIQREKIFDIKHNKYRDVYCYAILKNEYRRGELKWQLQK